MALVRLVLTDLAGVPQGELDKPHDRRLRHAFNGRPKTAACRIAVDNPLADFALSGQAMLKWYDGTALRFLGDLATFEEVSDPVGGSVALAFTDGWRRLGARLLGQSATGYADGDALTTRDKSVLVSNVITAANALGHTGVDLGTVTNVGTSSYLALTPYSPADTAAIGVINNLDGPDVELVPIEPTVAAGVTKIAVANIVPVLGTTRPDVVFEYATGRRNVVSYRRAGDLSLLLNRAFILPDTTAPAGAVLSAVDAASQTTYGLREGLVTNPGLTSDVLRQSLVNEHVRVRKAPRVQVTFVPALNDASTPGRVPQYGLDFGLGDVIRFRAVNPLTNATRVDAMLRVYAVDWTVNDEGMSQPSFTLTAD